MEPHCYSSPTYHHPGHAYVPDENGAAMAAINGGVDANCGPVYERAFYECVCVRACLSVNLGDAFDERHACLRCAIRCRSIHLLRTAHVLYHLVCASVTSSGTLPLSVANGSVSMATLDQAAGAYTILHALHIQTHVRNLSDTSTHTPSRSPSSVPLNPVHVRVPSCRTLRSASHTPFCITHPVLSWVVQDGCSAL